MMISIQGVSKEFKGEFRTRRVTALQNLDLEVAKGEVFGFLGPNGAGKSTTIKILLNLIYPTAGTAFILGKNVSDSSVRQNVGYLPENPYFYDHLTVEELLWFGGRTSGISREVLAERMNTLLARVNLLHARRRPIRTFSKGMVQRAGLALALVHDPEVVILDEPMSGLDPLGRKMVGDLILEMKSQGRTVFFSSHILSDIERFCDRAGIIVSGRLRRAGRMDDLLSGASSLEAVFLREVAEAGGGGDA